MKRSWQAQVAEYTAMAFVLPCSSAAGYVIGYLLDKAFGTHWLSLAFLILGTVGGFIELLRQLQRDTRDDREP